MIDGGGVTRIQERYRGHQVIGIDTVWEESSLQDQWGMYLVGVRVVLTIHQSTARGVVP